MGTGISAPFDRLVGVVTSFMPVIIFVGYKVVRTSFYTRTKLGPGIGGKDLSILWLGILDVVFYNMKMMVEITINSRVKTYKIQSSDGKLSKFSF